MRILFVTTEHEGGTTHARRELYERARARFVSLTDAAVEAVPYWEVESPSADALILSGSYDPWALHDRVALERFYEVLRGFHGPVLGICAGMQMLVRARGGNVAPAPEATRGFVTVEVLDASDLLAGTGPSFDAFQSHEDEVSLLPIGFRILAASETCSIEAIAADDRPWWGTQFHPEAFDSEHPVGQVVVERFLHLAEASLTTTRRRGRP